MKSPERTDLHIRLPAELHVRLVASAAGNDRTLNAEIIFRLRRSFDGYTQDLRR